MKFNIFKNFPYRVYIRDEKGNVIYANELACDFLEMNADELIGKSYEDVFIDEKFISHLIKMDKKIFSEELKSFTSIHEYNRCYNKETIFKVVEYLYIYEKMKFIVTLLVELSDSYSKEYGIDLKIGEYDPSNRILRLKTGTTVCLTRLENSFLFLLYEKKGQVVTYDELFLILDTNNAMTKESLKALIYRLKRKLDIDIIENVSMQGYRITIFNKNSYKK